MTRNITRREFLKKSAAAGVLFLAGDLFQGYPFACGTTNIPETEGITITIIITDSYAETTKQNYRIATRYAGNLDAEHGLACHVETVVNGRSHSFLFDFGVNSPSVSRNMEALGIEFEKLEALALSHGHNDHWGGLLRLLKSRRDGIRQGIPLYVGEEAFAERFNKRPDGSVVKIPQLKKEDIQGLGFVNVIEIKDPTPIASGAYLTGRIERRTEYEKGLEAALIKREDHIEQDDFLGEQAVVMNVKGKGLVVLSGCAHVGIVNTVKHAQRMTGVGKVHAILGGFHLMGAKRELIWRTVADIKAMSPDFIVPMHCTGVGAIGTFAREMPDQLIPGASGMKYRFTS